MADLAVGSRVDCAEKGKGTVAFLGTTKFADGEWVGIVLDEKKGKNDGSVQGVPYFKCEPHHGVFMRPDTVKLDNDGSKLPKPKTLARQSTGIKKPAASSKAPSARSSKLNTPKMSPAPSMERLSMKPTMSRKSSAVSTGETPNDLKRTTRAEAPDTKRDRIPEVSPQPEQHQRPTLSREPSETPSVKDMARKIDLDVTANQIFVGQDMFAVDPNQTESLNIQIMRDEIADLTEKLESLRAKRKEDLAKLTEFDRLKINYQTLVEFKSSMTDELRAHRRKVEEAEMRAAEAEERARQAEETVPGDLTSELEMLTLDKELAQERVELLQQELTEKSARVEELEVELELLKTEMASEVSNDGDIAGNSIQVKQLNQKVDQYQAVIVKMRDLVNTSNMEKQSMQQQLEQFQKEYAKLQTEVDRKSTELSGAKAIIEDLRDQVDAALGSTRMVDHLSAQNLELEDQLRNLIAEKDHFSELYLLSEDICNANRQSVVEVRAECDSYVVALSEKDLHVRQLENQISEYENVVQKFRQKISDLNNDIVGFKDQVNMLESQLSIRGLDSSSMSSLSASRDFSKVVAGALDALELKYAKEHIQHLKEFLPDNFSKAGGDYDGVLLTVFFPRMAEKAELMCQLLTEKFPELPSGINRDHVTLSHKGEQWAHVRRFHYQLKRIFAVVRRFESVTKTCTAETLQRLSQQRTEITCQERVVDQYFDLLKQNRLDENTAVDHLEHCANIFNKIIIINMNSCEFDTRVALADNFQQFSTGLSWAKFNVVRLQLFLLPGEDEGNDLVDFLDSLVSECSDSATLVSRASKLIPTHKTVDWNQDLQEMLVHAETSLEKFAKILQDTAGLAVSQLTTNDVQGFSAAELKEFIQSKVEKRVEGQRNVDEALSDVSTTLSTFKSVMSDLCAKLDKGSFEKPLQTEKKYTPLQDRAMARRQDVVDVESLRWQISKKDEEYKRVYRMFKDQDDTLKAIKIQLERAKKKNQDMDKNEAAIDPERLQDALREEAKKWESKVNELEIQLDEAEKSRDRLRDQLETQKKNRHNANLLLGADNTTNKIPGADLGPSEAKHALLWTQDKVRRLQAELSSKTLVSMKPLKVPERVCGPVSLKKQNENNVHSLLKSFVTEADILSMEHKKLISQDPKTRDVHYDRNVIEYNNRVLELRHRARSFWTRNMAGTALPAALTAVRLQPEEHSQPDDWDTAFKECEKAMAAREKQSQTLLAAFQ